MGLLDDIVVEKTKEGSAPTERCSAFSRGRWKLEMREIELRPLGHLQILSRRDEQRMRVVRWMAEGIGSVDVAE